MSILCHASVRCRRYFQNRICVHEISTSVCNTILDLKFLFDVKFSFATVSLEWDFANLRVRRALYSIMGFGRLGISLSVTWNCGCRYLEQYRTASRYHACQPTEKPKDTGRDVHCPLVLRTPLTPPKSLSPKMFSFLRRFGSSVLPADFSGVAYNGCVMRCVVKNET